MAGAIREASTAYLVLLRGLRARAWSSLSACLSISIVVGVLTATLAMGAGYQDAMSLSNGLGGLMVLSNGASSETESTLTGDQVGLITGIASGLGATGSAEAFIVAKGRSATADKPVNIAVRGVVPATALQYGAKLTGGRMFQAERRELIVGQMAKRSFANLNIGDTVSLANLDWVVTGTFAAGGSVMESEVWTDASTLQSAFQRGDVYQLVVLHADQTVSPGVFRTAFAKDPRLDVSVTNVAEFYAEQGRQMQSMVKTLALWIGVLLGCGAVLALMNTGFAQVKACSREIATMAALGWTRPTLTVAVTVEALTLCVIGAVIGSQGMSALLNGHLVSTLFFSRNASQVAFALHVTPLIVLEASVVALVIGLVGSIGPAILLGRLPITRILADRR